MSQRLITAIKNCLPDLTHYANTHGPGPDRRLAELRAVMTGGLVLFSATRPAGGGCLPCRICLHAGNEVTPFVTHLEAQQSDGHWSRCDGHYHRDGADALTDYMERCASLGVVPISREVLGC